MSNTKSNTSSLVIDTLLFIAFFAVMIYVLTCIHQSDFVPLLLSTSVLFGLYVSIYRRGLVSHRLNYFIGVGLLIRLAGVAYPPLLSDDIYRFIWDGMLWHDGINPFSYLPSDLMTNESMSSEYATIFPLLNSPNYYSIYPPICQLVFYLGTFDWLPQWLYGGVAWKLIFFFAECLTIYYLRGILRQHNMPDAWVLLYVFNPLLIIEFMGNLHFECLMMSGIAAIIYFINKKSYGLAGLAFAMAICVKLVPLLFGPFVLMYLWSRREGWQFFLVSMPVTIIAFGVMLHRHVWGILQSIDLYFQSFEFNASIYYISRYIGYKVLGYNGIAFIGPLLSLLALGLILYISWYGVKKRIDIATLLMSLFTVYLLFATTVHPWYLSTIVLLAVISRFRYPLLWSYLIVLSYAAYQYSPVDEQLWLIAFEYLLVGVYLYIEYEKAPEKNLRGSIQ